MAVTATYNPTTSRLFAQGDLFDRNVVTVGCDAAGLLLVNGGTVPIQGGTPTIANTTGVSLIGGGDNDLLIVDEANGVLPVAALFGHVGDDTLIAGSTDDRLQGEVGNDTLVGGRGNDRLFGGTGNDLIIWLPGDGNDLIDGNEDFDVLHINVADVAETFTIEANGERVRVRGISPDPFTLDVGTTEYIRIDGNGGDDTVSTADNLAAMVALELNGDAGNDTLNGGGAIDTLSGGDDQDTLFGKGGADFLYGDAGHDTLIGGDGNDQMTGGDGNDRMVWNAGDDSDTIEGGDDSDTLEINGGETGEEFVIANNGARVSVFIGADDLDMASTERIVVWANGGDDIISAAGLLGLASIHLDGGDGNDTIRGAGAGIAEVIVAGNGSDWVDSNEGSDQVSLGGGDDTFVWDAGDGPDTVRGEDGFDTAQFYGSGNDAIAISANGPRARFERNSDGQFVNLDGVERLEVNAGAGEDVVLVSDLTGTGVTQVYIDLAPLVGGPGPNPVPGDTVQVNGTNGNDIIEVLPGTFRSYAVTGLSARIDVHQSEAERDHLIVDGGDGNDTITAGAGDLWAITTLTIYGGAGADVIVGGNGNDALIGDLGIDGAGNDVIRGGWGNDTAYLGAGDDIYVWNAGDGIDLVEGWLGFDTLDFNGSDSSETYNISGAGERVYLVYNAAPFPMDLDDVETIDLDTGGGSDDVVVGSLAGTDITGAITIALGDGSDELSAQAATTSVIAFGQAGVDGLNGGQANDTLHGGDDNDIVSGNAGNDALRGGAGNDSLQGGDGSDTAFFSGSRADYVISIPQPGYVQIADQRPGSPDGTDILSEIEFFAFTDGVYTLAGLFNRPPAIISNGGGDGATVAVAENATQVTTVMATDPDAGTVLTYAIVGGADAARFQINAATGALSFIAAPDFEAPADAGSNNRYDVVVRASDGTLFDDQAIAVNVTNVIGVNLSGNASDNYLVGSSENDTISGLAGNDRLAGGLGADALNGGDGNDTADFLSGAGVTVDLATGTASNGSVDTLTSIERVVGSQLADTIRGNGGDNVLDGASGNDVIEGRGGNDRLEGGAGNDKLNGGDGNDDLVGQSGNDTLDGANGDDLVRGGDGDDNLEGRDGNDRLEGEAGNDTIDAGAGNDRIFGGDGNDRIFAAGGIDTVTGGTGNDMFYYTNSAPGQMNGDTITDFQSVAGQNTGDTLLIRAGYSSLVLNNGSTAVTYNGVTETLYHPGVTLSLANDILVV